jgi:hypothetical protein
MMTPFFKKDDSKKEIINLNDVFTSAGMPKKTYVDRDNGKLFERLSGIIGSGKMIIVTGLTKSGKTVLVKRLLEKQNSLWLDGGSFSDEDSFWNMALENLGGFNRTESSSLKSKDNSTTGEFGGGIILAKLDGTKSEKAQEGLTQQREVSSKSEVIKILKERKTPVVIDDFHYLNDSIKKNVIRAFKSLAFDNVPIILIAIPHRNSEIFKSEREMTGRVESINIPIWPEQDLKQIAVLGFPYMNTEVEEKIINYFIKQSRGSPSLMQEFCRNLCIKNEIKDNSKKRNIISLQRDFFSEIAEFGSRDIFRKLKAGPSTHGKERKKYPLIQGGEEETYGLILLALKKIKPSVGTIKYDDLKKTILEITNKPPQKHQITFSLGNMSKISINDSASSPVVDWENNDGFLHITDPFFSFFLEWGG